MLATKNWMKSSLEAQFQVSPEWENLAEVESESIKKGAIAIASTWHCSGDRLQFSRISLGSLNFSF